MLHEEGGGGGEIGTGIKEGASRYRPRCEGAGACGGGVQKERGGEAWDSQSVSTANPTDFTQE